MEGCFHSEKKNVPKNIYKSVSIVILGRDSCPVSQESFMQCFLLLPWGGYFEGCIAGSTAEIAI